MSPLGVLLVLLATAYLGSSLLGRRGRGLPSGVEWVGLGFLVGPAVLGLVGPGIVESFTPLAHVALGWIGLVVGLDYGRVGTHRIRVSTLVLATAAALLAGAAVAASVFAVLRRAGAAPNEQWLIAGGAGAACAETARQAVQWVATRAPAHGPVTDLLTEFSDADDLVPVGALTVLFALVLPEALSVSVPFTVRVAIVPALGLVLGGVTALLVGQDFRPTTFWGVLFGTSMVAIGLALRMGASELAVCFAMGLATAATSRHRAEVRALVVPLERPILLPMLLLAGARLDFRTSPLLPAIVTAALFARAVVKALTGVGLTAVISDTRRARRSLGFGLLASGTFSMCVGLSFALRFPGPVGGTVLVVAALSTALGELVAPPSLRRALRQVGEVIDPEPEALASRSAEGA